jgi:hypothetical protein
MQTITRTSTTLPAIHTQAAPQQQQQQQQPLLQELQAFQCPRVLFLEPRQVGAAVGLK